MMLRSKAPGLSLGIAAILFLILFTFDTSANFGRRGGFGGGGFTGGYSTFNRQSPPRPTVAPSFTRQQPSIAPGSSVSGPPVPQVSQAPYPNARSTTGPRQLPRAIDPQSPLGRSPAYKGQIAQTGAPILVNGSGKRFVVPMRGILSARASLVSGSSRSALNAGLSAPERKVIWLESRFREVAKHGKIVPRPISTTLNPLSGASLQKTVYDIFMPDGKPIGRRFGRARPNVKTISFSEIEIIEKRLMALKPTLIFSNSFMAQYKIGEEMEFSIRSSKNNGKTIGIQHPSIMPGFKVHYEK